MNVSKEKLEEIQDTRRKKILKVIKDIGYYNEEEDIYQISITNLSEYTGIGRTTISSDLQELRSEHKIELFPRKIVFGIRIEK